MNLKFIEIPDEYITLALRAEELFSRGISHYDGYSCMTDGALHVKLYHPLTADRINCDISTIQAVWNEKAGRVVNEEKYITTLVLAHEEEEDIKHTILACASDAISSFLYYDRKGDEELPVGIIEEAINCGKVTVDEILEVFRENIEKRL